ncbi:hypothetical protein J0D14_002955 [Listeria monocytogenes]|nr:hypothetical protein [Listeria monocytogenes]
MHKVKSGVNIMYKFALSNSKTFQEYIDYIDRNEATRNQHADKFSLFNEYMGNPAKTSALFTADHDNLSDEKKKDLKKSFESAQEKGSIMWQDVISFDPYWLEEQGLYNRETKEIDQIKIREITRNMMQAVLKREGLGQSAIWSAAIHLNTKHPHVHIAVVEPEPTRTRGKWEQGTWKLARSKVVNDILNLTEDQKLITELIRNQIVGGQKQRPTLHDKELKKQFIKVFQQLPSDRRQWSYNYNTLNALRPDLHQLMDMYLAKHEGNSVETIHEILDKNMEAYRRAYGEGKYDRGLYKDYKKNKIDDLYERLGNSFLKEMRAYDKRLLAIEKKGFHPGSTGYQINHGRAIDFALKKINKYTKQDYQSWKNQMVYQRMQEQMEREKIDG